MAVQATALPASPAMAGAPARVSKIIRELPLIPGAVLALLVLTAVFADVIAPYDPTLPVAGARISMPPAWMEGGNPNLILGTDRQGRDMLSRVIHGARVTLIVAVTGTAGGGGHRGPRGGIARHLRGPAAQALLRPTHARQAL